MKSGLYYMIGILFVSCQTVVIDDLDVNRPDEYVNRISFDMTVPESTDYDDTRYSVVYSNAWWSNSTYLNYFYNGDTIGIFPSKGDQIPFPLEGLAAPQTAFDFTGTGWDLKTDGTAYYAYTPFERSNYEDNVNIHHVNIKYYGQEEHRDFAYSETATSIDSNYTQSRYNYMYSYKTLPDMSGELLFKLKNIGGVIRIKCLWSAATNGTAPSDTFILAKIVTTNQVFVMEGSYDLMATAHARYTADSLLAVSSGNPNAEDLSFVPTLTPSKRGKTNVFPMKLDSITPGAVVQLKVGTITLNGTGFVLNFLSHPVDLRSESAELHLYTTDMKHYKSNISFSAPIKASTTMYLTAYPRYEGYAMPADISINPWGDEEETINSNWNYK